MAFKQLAVSQNRFMGGYHVDPESPLNAAEGDEGRNAAHPLLEEGKSDVRPGARIAKYVLNERWLLLVGAVVVLGVGLGCGLLLPAEEGLPAPWGRVSGVIGWTYFACWSVSFYPQAYLNWKRKSVVGLSLDFQAFNILGFSCYLVFNLALYCSRTVQEAYAASGHSHGSGVRANDVFFAAHAMVLTIITGLQCCFYHRGNQVISAAAVSVVSACGLSAALYLVFYLIMPQAFTLLGLLYFLSYIKLGVTCCKYIPQVILNHERKSTDGWNIWNVITDLGGGVLSIIQLCMDAIVLGDWSVVTGDPVKLGLGLVSIGFDLYFMLQHYVLFPAHRARARAKKGASLDDGRGLATLLSAIPEEHPAFVGAHGAASGWPLLPLRGTRARFGKSASLQSLQLADRA